MGKNDPTYVRLDDQAAAAVAGFIEAKGGTKSSAINMIIREWSRMQVPVIGKVDSETGKISIQEELDRR